MAPPISQLVLLRLLQRTTRLYGSIAGFLTMSKMMISSKYIIFKIIAYAHSTETLNQFQITHYFDFPKYISTLLFFMHNKEIV